MGRSSGPSHLAHVYYLQFFEVFIFWRQVLDFQFHPAAAETINQKSAALLEEVRLLRFSKSKKEEFVGDRVSTAIGVMTQSL